MHSKRRNPTYTMRAIFVVFFLVSSLFSKGQTIFSTQQGWSDISIWYHVSPSIKMGGDFGYRATFDLNTYHQLYFRPTIQWRINKTFSASFAASNFHSVIDDAVDLNEMRLAQQVTIRWPKIGPFKMSHRVRVEERFFLLESNKANAQRLRYRIKLAPPNFRLFDWNSSFYSGFTWEAFINLGSSYENLLGNGHRYEIVMGNKISTKVSAGLHYIWQTTLVADETFDLKDNVLRLRFGYTINPKDE
ncbi:MAG: DUF2490 domain-containing protein [Reichenbachiella sp.]